MSKGHVFLLTTFSSVVAAHFEYLCLSLAVQMMRNVHFFWTEMTAEASCMLKVLTIGIWVTEDRSKKLGKEKVNVVESKKGRC